MLERLMGHDTGLVSPLFVFSGACFILGTCVLPVLRMRRDNVKATGPDCRPDEPLEGSKCCSFCVHICTWPQAR